MCGDGERDHHAVLCKVRLVETWIKIREEVNDARGIRNKMLRITLHGGISYGL